jgi:predicted RNA-binding protein YlxR (DUF448 family)
MARQPQPTRPKHVPQRTCIACRRVAGKRSFVRVVRTAQGVEIDPTGKRAGRGAYLHPNQQCWQAALAGNRLGQALRTTIDAESKAQLLAYMATLPSTDESLHALSQVDD